MLFILNGAIHEVETRYRRKDGQKRRCKYFYAFIVYVMLVGILHLKSMQLVTITKSQMYRACYKVDSLSVKAFK